MNARNIIISLLLMATSVGKADAKPTCETVDDVWQTLSVMRQIEADGNNSHYAENIRKLETLTAQIFVPELVSQEFQKNFPEHSQALFLYLSHMREAVDAANAGHNDYAKETLNRLVHGDYEQSTLLLQAYLGCSRQEAGDASAFLFLNSLGAHEGTTPEGALVFIDDTTEQSNAGDVSETGGGKSDKRELSKSPDTLLLKEGTVLFLLIVAIGGLIATYAFFKSHRQLVQRSERHFCNVSTQILLGKKTYPVTILDITMMGIKIHHNGAIRRKRPFKVLIDGEWHTTNTKWFNATFAGVQFKRPIDADALQSVLTETKFTGLSVVESVPDIVTAA